MSHIFNRFYGYFETQWFVRLHFKISQTNNKVRIKTMIDRNVLNQKPNMENKNPKRD